MKLLLVALLALAAPAAADPILTNVQPTTCVPDVARRDTAVIGDLNPQLFAAATLDTDTDEGVIRATRRSASATEWAGITARQGTGVFTVTEDVVTGSVNQDGRTWELMPNCGRYVLYEIDPAAKPPQADDAPPSPGAIPTFEPATSVRGPTLHDVLLLYTAAAETKYTLPTLKSKFSTAIANTNLWFNQSGSDQQFRIAAIVASPVQESGTGIAKTWQNLQSNAQAKALRDQYRADEVLLASNDKGGGIGYGGLWYGCCTSSGGLTVAEMWAVVNSNYLLDDTFAHEVGHMLGADHNRENSGDKSPGYHYGYRLCLQDGTGFRTIMSYQCPSYGVPRIVWFSNPKLSYTGYPLGVDYAKDTDHASDVVRTLNEMGPKLAAFRGVNAPPAPTPPPPGIPRNLIATKDGAGNVTLTWGYADNTATTAEIQKATLNPTNGKWPKPAKVGSVNAPNQSFTHRPGNGTHRYYVLAKNSGGSSTPAGPVAVVMP